ncbi:MAG: diacylglycerol/lipid kinase family protein [Candidatus Izemoplasmataceae bacterium]
MYILLYNPLSKNKKSKHVTKKLVDYFKKHNIPFRVKSLLKIQDLSQFIEAKPKEIHWVVLGGDGTINTFINQTYDLDIPHPIYLKKSGSGNDFLRSLKRQTKPLQHVAKLVYNDTPRYFVNGAGMGIDGMIANNVNQSKRKHKLNYLMQTIKALVRYTPQTLNVTIDGVDKTFKKAYLINVNNGSYVGGGMRLTPFAKPEEDALDVLIVHKGNKFLLILIFLSVYLGLHTKVKRYVYYQKAHHVKATMSSPQIAQCDGECFSDTVSLEVSLTKKIMHIKPFEVKKTR